MKYKKPEVDVIIYENVDIITLSGGDPVAPQEPVYECPTILTIYHEIYG